MERLTKRLNDGKALCIGVCEKECVEGYSECHKCEPFVEVVKKLADYEDAEDKGLLPKFRMADEFWIIDCCKRITKAKVVMLQQKKDKTWIYRLCDVYSHTYDYKENDFGTRFFATKEEAEQALKQMGINDGKCTKRTEL